jgi:tetratricopeptide (TPR) repeat protein
MSSSVNIAGDLQSQLTQVIRRLPRILKIAGIIVLIAGLQTYGFYKYFNPRLQMANQNLDRLMNEVGTNDFVNSVLNNFGDLRRISDDDAYRGEIVQIYERFIGEFLENPLAAIDEFDRITATLSPPAGALGEESLARLRAGVEEMKSLYADHYAVIVDRLESPPLYLQPTASIIKNHDNFTQSVQLNHGMYLSVVGNRGEANTIFNDLKQADISDELLSVVHYAQARLLFDAFKTEGQFDYYQQAMQSLKQSLNSNPEYGQPKLFLEYLLSLERGSSEVNAPVTGDGTGEAEGERGVISSAPPNF